MEIWGSQRLWKVKDLKRLDKGLVLMQNYVIIALNNFRCLN